MLANIYVWSPFPHISSTFNISLGTASSHLLLKIQKSQLKLYGPNPNTIYIFLLLNIHIWDFPGGPVVENPPSNAGDVGSLPGRGTKIPHATGQLSLCAATTEPACSRAHVPQLERSPMCCNERSRVPQLRPDAAK